MKTRIKVKGSFTVEAALVLMFFSGISVTFLNYVIAMNVKGQLDRTSYSIVTVIAERKQFFGGDVNLCKVTDLTCSEIKKEIDNLATSSLKRVLPNFDREKLGIYVEQLSVEGGGESSFRKEYKSFSMGNLDGCNLPNVNSLSLADAKEILPTTSHNRKLPLYQITLCYDTPFNIFGANDGSVVKTVSTSFSFARV